MSVHEFLEEFGGLPVFTFPESADAPASLPEVSAVAWRLSHDPYGDGEESSFEELWERFTGAVDLSGVRALIIGQWGEAYDNTSEIVVSAIVAAKDRFTGLRAVFLGEIAQEEAEISWIQQSDVSPLLTAFPALEVLIVRGGSELEFPVVRHEALRELRLESGGLPAEVVRGVCGSDFPALESLVLWLGVPEYGGDYEIGDLAGALSGARFPRLRHLGLQNSEIQDEIAAAVAAAPVVAGLESLDLSMGTLTDTGAEALVTGQPLTHLKKLDLEHHFLTPAMAERVRTTLTQQGVEVVIGESERLAQYEDRVWRYAAVTE
ncbi:STM4015 family protein [Streptomyces sp. NPDC059101]|uniref:STM4015 family protein n=1 Tax=Streptomyces sp. NPDC059101 TaxID=3346728 RepID=UPI00369BA12E